MILLVADGVDGANAIVLRVSVTKLYLYVYTLCNDVTEVIDDDNGKVYQVWVALPDWFDVCTPSGINNVAPLYDDGAINNTAHYWSCDDSTRHTFSEPWCTKICDPFQSISVTIISYSHTLRPAINDETNGSMTNAWRMTYSAIKTDVAIRDILTLSVALTVMINNRKDMIVAITNTTTPTISLIAIARRIIYVSFNTIHNSMNEA
jgi:hypothetical protein